MGRASEEKAKPEPGFSFLCTLKGCGEKLKGLLKQCIHVFPQQCSCVIAIVVVTVGSTESSLSPLSLVAKPACGWNIY